MVYCLRLCTSNAGGTGSIPGQGTKIPQGAQPKKKKSKTLLGIEKGSQSDYMEII